VLGAWRLSEAFLAFDVRPRCLSLSGHAVPAKRTPAAPPSRGGFFFPALYWHRARFRFASEVTR